MHVKFVFKLVYCELNMQIQFSINFKSFLCNYFISSSSSSVLKVLLENLIRMNLSCYMLEMLGGKAQLKSKCFRVCSEASLSNSSDSTAQPAYVLTTHFLPSSFAIISPRRISSTTESLLIFFNKTRCSRKVIKILFHITIFYAC